MRDRHALVVDDEFLVYTPNFHLPGEGAEGSGRLGLHVRGQRRGQRARVVRVRDGGFEEQVAQAGEVGFFAGFAGGRGGGGALRRGGFRVAGEHAGVARPAVVVGGAAAEGVGVAACAGCAAVAGGGAEDEDVGDGDRVGWGGRCGCCVVEDGRGCFRWEGGGGVVVLSVAQAG